MSDGLMSVRYHVSDLTDEEVSTRTHRTIPLPGDEQPPEPSFQSDETAARFFLDRALDLDDRKDMRDLRAPHRPELVPDLSLESVHEQPLTGTRLVRFQQRLSAIPVFGSQAIVELTEDRQLVSLDAEVASPGDLGKVSAMPSLGPAQALGVIAQLTGKP